MIYIYVNVQMIKKMKKVSALFDVAIGAFDRTKDANLLANSYSTNYLKIRKKESRIYTVMMDQEFLRTSVDQPQKKLKKYVCKLFRKHDFELTIQCNRKVGNFLDVTLNLENSSYRP